MTQRTVIPLDKSHDSTYGVEEEVDDRVYFTQIPNLIFELNMSREAVWLYVHLKRVAGDKGECFQSLNTLAKKTRMSKPTVIKVKTELINNSLIRIQPAARGDKPDIITIRNIWHRNIEYFDKVVNQKTALVNQKTAPGKGENPKKNPPKKEPFKKLGKQKKQVLSTDTAREADRQKREASFQGKEWLLN